MIGNGLKKGFSHISKSLFVRGSRYVQRVASPLIVRLLKMSRKEIIAGFTLVELLVVIAMLGTLSGIAIPAYSRYIDKARITKAIAEIIDLQKAIMLYEIEQDTLPDSLDDLGRGNLLDPWGNAYQYLNFATVKGKGKMRKDRWLVPINDFYDLYSMGKDGRTVAPLTAAMSHDDIIRANNGRYIGLASEF
jgi:general secretion pathway protein G